MADLVRSRRRTELMLAVLPTIVVLSVFAIVEEFARQRLLFTSLASSAFLMMFALALGMLAILVVLQRSSVWLARRWRAPAELPEVAK